jgi:AraC-like DNA-binding protein
MDKHSNNREKNYNGIAFVENVKTNIEGEHYLPNHSFSYNISGTITISDGAEIKTFGKGEFLFNSGKRLAKVRKSPDPDGVYKAIVIFMDDETLHELSKEYPTIGKTYKKQETVFSFTPDILLRNYFDSLMPYFDMELPETLITLKKNEGIMLLLNQFPELANTLFNFSAPGKIDLEAFMNQNFKYNSEVKNYAYLTGRSLATFKRDFRKTFNTTPNRWIQQRRLEEAYFLIKEKKRKPSEVYLEVGFETLSHFSYTFKERFGVNPSAV